MDTVSHRAKNYKQPRGGFINPKQMNLEIINDNITLKNENISPSLVGLVVDYMTRFLDGEFYDAFEICIMGAEIIGMKDKAKELLKNITDLNDESLISACKLVGFDSVLRAGPITYKPIEDINPNQDTIFNIKIMVNRSLNFLKKYGPVVKYGMTFIGGYTPTVISGDGDFMTNDTIWDFKVSKNPIKSWHILQLVMYYLMGCKAISLNAEYDFANKIKKIGIYNPRLNYIYTLNISDIDKEVLNQISSDVIGYGEGITDPHLKKIIDKINNKK